jgi:hypothetical protein
MAYVQWTMKGFPDAALQYIALRYMSPSAKERLCLNPKLPHSKGRVLAMVSRANALSWTADPKVQELSVAEAVEGSSLLSGYDDEIVGALADRMIARDVGRVPILSRATHKLVELVSRRDLLKVRASLAHQETHRSQGFA